MTVAWAVLGHLWVPLAPMGGNRDPIPFCPPSPPPMADRFGVHCLQICLVLFCCGCWVERVEHKHLYQTSPHWHPTLWHPKLWHPKLLASKTFGIQHFCHPKRFASQTFGIQNFRHPQLVAFKTLASKTSDIQHFGIQHFGIQNLRHPKLSASKLSFLPQAAPPQCTHPAPSQAWHPG